jgi:hypothetical protein
LSFPCIVGSPARAAALPTDLESGRLGKRPVVDVGESPPSGDRMEDGDSAKPGGGGTCVKTGIDTRGERPTS